MLAGLTPLFGRPPRFAPWPAVGPGPDVAELRRAWPGRRNPSGTGYGQGSYRAGFYGLTEEAQEHAFEEAMTLRMAQTLVEFGLGSAFVGRQYSLDVDGDGFFIDLMMHHVPSNRWVVVEL